ncbi:hypothetical protein BGZ57DRAFT_1008661 [Hyaloscypha finlandica]|nr:hypothetical protein BGZ57DRAFT_1008661 [Hyaloscypha finlandica]
MSSSTSVPVIAVTNNEASMVASQFLRRRLSFPLTLMQGNRRHSTRTEVHHFSSREASWGGLFVADGGKYTKRGITLANYLVKWVPRGITITTIRPQEAKYWYDGLDEDDYEWIIEDYMIALLSRNQMMTMSKTEYYVDELPQLIRRTSNHKSLDQGKDNWINGEEYSSQERVREQGGNRGNSQGQRRESFSLLHQKHKSIRCGIPSSKQSHSSYHNSPSLDQLQNLRLFGPVSSACLGATCKSMYGFHGEKYGTIGSPTDERGYTLAYDRG